MSPSLITTSPGAKSVTAMCLATSRCCASVSFDVYGFACKARMISARVLCGFHPNVGSARNQQRFNVSHSFQLTHVHTHTHIHTLTHSLTHSLTPSLLHSFTPSLLHSLTPSLLHSFTPSLLHSFTPSLTHSLTHSLTLHAPTLLGHH